MPKLDHIEQSLEKLGSLKTAPPGPDLDNDLRAFLRNRSNLVAAKAAKIAGERRSTALVPDLVAAFHKRMTDPHRLDKRCAALTESVIALYAMEYDEPDVYARGIRHVQMEPSWGGPVDTAAHLRGLCAQALVRTRFPDALASNGGDAGTLALRLKVLTGDSEPEVLAECFSGLLAAPSRPDSSGVYPGPVGASSGLVGARSDPVGDNALAFVAAYIDSEDEAVAEAAILALGASRSLKAFAVLKQKWEDGKWAKTPRSPLRKILLLAFATSRNEDALTLLLTLLETAPRPIAAEVLTTLAAQNPAARVRTAIEATLTRRADNSLLAAFQRDFSSGG